MKKIIAAVAFAVMCSFSIFAQVSTDPSDSFYDMVERWEIQKIISEQPPLRPYPLNVIQSILEEVIESDNEAAAEEAQNYYDQHFKRAFKLKGGADSSFKFNNDDNEKQIVAFGGVDGDFAFPKYLTAGYKINVVATNDVSLDALPMYSAQRYYFIDAVDLKKLKSFLDMDTSIALGNEKLFGQMGVSNSTFGPFYKESAVISPNAKHTANFSLVYNGGRVSYTQALFGLSAANALEDEDNQDLFSKKFLSMHSINGKIFDWLTASFYEVSIYGDRLEPAYLIPIPYIITQGLSGFDDNIFMGLSFTLRPVPDFVWVNDFFVDDLGLEDVIRLNFDTKIRGTFQSAFKYAPSSVSWLDMIKLDYTLVSPYMYAHKQNLIDPATGKFTTGPLSTINYQEYTTAGSPLGLSLPPNTERVGLSAVFAPMKKLKISVSGSYTRHANVNESLPVEEALSYLNSPKGYFSTDGGIHNHQHYLEGGDPEKQKYLPSAWEHFLFMAQETKMQTFHAGLGAEYTLDTARFGSLSLGLDYTFEFIKNYGVDTEIFKARGGHYVTEEDSAGNLVKKWQGNATEADVAASLAAWKAGLRDITNHYVRVFVKYTW